MAAEFDFIAWLRTRRAAGPSLATIGIGDDLAALRMPPFELVLVGIDQVLDGVHFDANVHAPADIGRKAVNRNLSDCAAMACRPVAAVLSLALPRGCGEEYAKQIYLGAEAAGAAHRCPIVGGDTGSWPGPLAVTVAIVGHVRDDPGLRRPATRGGAQPGDAIAVSGPLGGSILGRHMTFPPRVAFALALGDVAELSAMIDLSDGLSRDLRHVCDASGVGAVVRAADVPVHADVYRLPKDARPPLWHALHDGEDYELLFTFTGPTKIGPLADAAVIPIGHITAEPGVWLEHADGRREPLAPQSWEHAL